jgi:hypothetical protein
VSELLSSIEGVSYIQRVAVDSYKNLVTAKRAVEKALRYQIEGKGFSLIEILSPCPTDWGMSPKAAAEWVRTSLSQVYPLGLIKDKFGKRADLEGASSSGGSEDRACFLGECSHPPACSRKKCYLVSFLTAPRWGGTATARSSSREMIGSPVVMMPDILLAMNRAFLDRFLPAQEERPALYDSSYQGRDSGRASRRPGARDNHGRRPAQPEVSEYGTPGVTARRNSGSPPSSACSKMRRPPESRHSGQYRANSEMDFIENCKAHITYTGDQKLVKFGAGADILRSVNGSMKT